MLHRNRGDQRFVPFNLWRPGSFVSDTHSFTKRASLHAADDFLAVMGMIRVIEVLFTPIPKKELLSVPELIWSSTAGWDCPSFFFATATISGLARKTMG
jgi:hypothetical protein